MLRRLTAHIRQQYVGYLALFVALGGTAYAAATIGSSDIKSGAVLSRHIKDRQVKSADQATGSVGPRIVADNSLGGPDIAEGLLGTVPNADKLDGKHASDLAPHRINAAGVSEGYLYSFQTVAPGLKYSSYCAAEFGTFSFFAEGGGTINAMIVASGVETPSNSANINVSNGAHDTGFFFPDSGPNKDTIHGMLKNDSDAARAESQFIINTASRTYTVALHLSHFRPASGASSCQTQGTITIAE